MQKASYDIVVFLVVVTGLIIFMVAFIVSILYLYRKKQLSYEKNLEQLKLDHEKTILNTQLEIQEQTFQHISREIHDNISLSLTLAKLQLNTFDWNDKTVALDKITSSVNLLSHSIEELSHISKSLNAALITEHGLLAELKEEIKRVESAALFAIDYKNTGIPVFHDPQTELIIFRLIQESFNNIIKHAKASTVSLLIHYTEDAVEINIADNGIGFVPDMAGSNDAAGIKNMQSRIKMVNGTMQIKSKPGKGTSIIFKIPSLINE